jgi:hypothetical protein
MDVGDLSSARSSFVPKTCAALSASTNDNA